MFGFRGRIGYISPSIIELNAYDFYRIAPEGVGLIAATCMVAGWRKTRIGRRSTEWKPVLGSWGKKILRLRDSRRRAPGIGPGQRI